MNLFFLFFLIYTATLCNFFGYLSCSLLILACFLFFLAIFCKKISGGWNSLLVIFVIFHAIYGMYAPITIHFFNINLSELFSKNYKLDEYIYILVVASLGVLVGVGNVKIYKYKIKKNKYYLFFRNVNHVSVLTGFVASLFSAIDLYRVGGKSALIYGKAYYGELISNLSLTLPSDPCFFVSFILYVIHTKCFTYVKSDNFEKILFHSLYFLSVISYVSIKIVFGERYFLFIPILILYLGGKWPFRFEVIRFKQFAVACIIFIILGVIFSYRSLIPYAIGSSDVDILKIKNSGDNWSVLSDIEKYLGEFTVTFGNINEYIINNKKYYSKLYFGETFFIGLLQPVPSFMMFSDKPKQITYRFRDEYFPTEASRSVIAGTGFSSMLEGMMNFSFIGVFFYYYFVVKIIIYLEKIRSKYFDNIYVIFYYLYFSIVAFSFHRFAFGQIFSMIFYSSFIFTFSMFIWKKICSVVIR